MSENWNTADSWYAPLNQQGEEPNKSSKQKKGAKKRTGWRVVGAVVLVLALIAGSSVAFSQKGGEPTDADVSDGMPEKWEDFFKDFYTSVTTEREDINIPKYEYDGDFKLELKAGVGDELSLQELYKKCSGSIVAIKATRKDVAGYSWGTGIIMSEDGLILTNSHVINGYDNVKVTLLDNREYEALLVGADIISDVAVLKIFETGLSAAEFGDSGELEVGAKVAAIGNPLSDTLSRTLTDGIISAIDRGVQYSGHTMTVLQTNTAINEGNSGGALFNMYGQVIGITNMKMRSSYSNIEGIGFAIPSANVKTVADMLLEEGEYRGRTSIGITVGEIPQEAAEHYELPEGLYISAVEEKSDAAKKGIQQGDIVIAINSVEIKTTDQVLEIKNGMKVGDSMTITVWRNGEILDFEIVLVDTNDLN